MFFSLLFTLFNITFSYNIIFLPGSFVKSYFYKNMLDKIKNNLKEENINVTYKIGNYFDTVNKEPNTTLICHSFGGFFGLLKCIEDRSGNIDNCILINSHFNQRRKMPYPSINLKDVNQNVLTILTKNDDKLPLSKAIDDQYVSNYENLSNIEFIINNGTHYSSFEEDVNIVASQISTFINKKIKGKQMRTIDDVYIHESFNDFLSSKPFKKNQLFININNNNILYKTRDTDIDIHLKTLFTNTDTFTWNKIYLNITDHINSNVFLKTSNIFQFLYTWLFVQPKVTTIGKKKYADLIIFPISNSTIYYKLPYYI